MAALRDELQQALADKQAIETALDSQKLQLTQQDKTLEEWQAKVAELEAANDNTDGAAEMERLQQTLTALQNDKDAADSQVVVMEAALTAQQQELGDYRLQLAEFEQLVSEQAASTNSDQPAELAATQARLQASEAERVQAQQEIERLEGEMSELRAVMSEHIEQIESVRATDGALESELNMVREQAAREIAQLTAELAFARSQLGAGDEGDSLVGEAKRQELLGVQAALDERERELGSAEESRQMLEDSLEDTHREMDELKRRLDQVCVDLEEADFRRQEAEQARDQVEGVLQQMQQSVADAEATDLRDDRLKPSSRTIDISHVTGGLSSGSLLLGLLIGSVLLIGGLEAWSFLNGWGELFDFLTKK